MTDVNSCGPVAGTLDITQPAAVTGSIISQTIVSVLNGNDGSVTVTGTDGISPYMYKLDSGPYQNSGTFGSLAAGTYIVTIQDNNLCIFVIPVTITSPLYNISGTISSKTNVLCYGGSTGSANITGSGGLSPYEYNLNNGVFQASGTLNALLAGTYTVTVRDALLNSVDVNFVITQPSAPVTTSTTKTDVLCYGGSTGTATALGQGGTGPFTYAWNTTPAQNTSTATGLISGTYSVIVTDSVGCNVTGTVQITQPSELIITETHNDESCPAESDGSITLSLTGGTQPYSFFWSDGITTMERQNIGVGTYSVVATDINGCAVSMDILINTTGSDDCLEIPAIITPNNDGYNDTWIIKNIDMYPKAEIQIFNRWGKRVYQSKNILANPWDGTADGIELPTDSYHYILQLNDKESKSLNGVISVIR